MDGVISEYIESYIPEDCLRIFPELEDLLCYGCSANESKYIEEDEDGQKKIKICKSFAKKIWKVDNDEDLDKPSKRFDGCGLLADENNFQNITIDDEDENLGYIIPSKAFSNFADFINTLKIPYYEDYEIVVVDGNKENCFDNNYYLKVYPLLTLILFFGILKFL